MIDKLRSLADQLEKVTPGTWEIGESHESKAEVVVDGKVFCRVQVPRSWSFEEKLPDSVDVAEAICLGHNECPSVLRDAANEIERLRRVVSRFSKKHEDEDFFCSGGTDTFKRGWYSAMKSVREQITQELEEETQ